MTPMVALAALSGMLVATGLVVLVAALMGWDPQPPRLLAKLSARSHGPSSMRWVAAVAAALIAWAISGWPALGLGVGAGVIGLPIMFQSGGQAQRHIDRLESLEEWTRRLADLIALGMGLEQAIVQAARTAPESIATEVHTLAARIAARTSTEAALRAFADEMNDATADLVVAALILSSRRRGPGVSRALTGIADSAAEEVAARRRIEADRAKPRTVARTVTLVVLAVLAVGLLNSEYTAPYGTPLGQLVLAAGLAFFGGCLWWMHSMTVTRPHERLLTSRTGGAP